MICEYCHTDTVIWVGPLTDLSGTKCTSCGRTNCQVIHDEYDEAEDTEEPMDLEDRPAELLK